MRYPNAATDDVTVVVTNYNGGEILARTLATLRAVLGEGIEIIVADDGSEDLSPEDTRRHFPTVQLISAGAHTGRLNVIRNLGLRAATTPFVLLIDNDILILPGAVEKLLRVMRSSPSVLCCTPRLLDSDDHDIVYADGNYLHFLGVSGQSKRNQPVSTTPERPPHATFGGGIMLINMAGAAELGYFDEAYAIGWADDAEFQLRGRLRGLEALHVPSAVCVHASKDHGTRRSFGQFYNRYRLLLTVYSARTWILLSLPLLSFEIALTGLSARMGIANERFRAVRRIWSERAEIRALRTAIQSNRRVRDSEVLASGGMQLAGPMGHSKALKALTEAMNTVLDGYWSLVRNFL